MMPRRAPALPPLDMRGKSLGVNRRIPPTVGAWRFIPIMRTQPGETPHYVCRICGTDTDEIGPCVDRVGVVPCHDVTREEYAIATAGRSLGRLDGRPRKETPGYAIGRR